MRPNTCSLNYKAFLLNAIRKSAAINNTGKSEIFLFRSQNACYSTHLCRKLCYKYPTSSSDESICGRIIYHMNGPSKPLTLSVFNKSLCTLIPAEKSDIFGDFSDSKYERFLLDEDEKKEEEFTSNEVQVPNWKKLTPGQYANLVKKYLNKHDLRSALAVLDLIKENRDKPTAYVYSLLIRGYAKQGLSRECFKLYNNIKNHGLKPTPGTYTSLFTACALDKHEASLRLLENLKAELNTKQFPLNVAHYNAIMKAYSFHGKFGKVFHILHEMRQRNISLDNIVYYNLLHASLSDKKEGLKRALYVWHLMRDSGIKPCAFHYVTLFTVMKQCGIGNLNVNEALIPGNKLTQIRITDGCTADLLASPPVISKVYLNDKNTDVESANQIHSLNDTINADKLLETNPLLLFGGFDNIINQIKNDGIQPNVKLLTILLNLLPPTEQSEETILNYVQKYKTPLDAVFFNTLMLRRVVRKDFDGAMSIINKMEENYVTPNVVTFSILAIGCNTRKQGWELINGIEAMGYVPERNTLQGLLYNACKTYNFNYIMDMLNYARKNRIQLDDTAFTVLNKFNTIVQEKLKTKKSWILKDFKSKYNVFKLQYDEWYEAVRNSKKRQKY